MTPVSTPGFSGVTPMRTPSRPVCCLAVLAIAAGLARAENDPKAIISKAIKAHGGEANLTKYKAPKAKVKGTIEQAGMSIEFTAEAATQLPNQFRVEIKAEAMGNALTIIQVLNKDKGWMSLNGMTM